MRPARDDFRLPPIEPEGWLDGPAAAPGDLAGRVVLVDFWDYTCIHCIRSLPHMSEWARRYREAGLVVVGVHAPELNFAAERHNVEAAVRSLGLRYPVALDGDRRVWRALDNRYLPARYLAGRDGLVRFVHFGDGAYAETEAQLRDALLAGRVAELLPEPSVAMTFAAGSATAVEGAVPAEPPPGELCQATTPTLHLDTVRGRFGNGPCDFADTGVEVFRDEGDHEPDRVYLGGRWELREGWIEHRGVAEATITVRYTAAEVNVLMTPPAAGPCSVVVDAPDGPVAFEVREPRAYPVVRNESVREGSVVIRLPAECDGLRAHAFTFMPASWGGPRPPGTAAGAGEET